MITNPDGTSNPTIQTFSGHMFDIFNPDPSLIEVADIGHALSMLCRYGGHSREFYSVAEHSVLMSQHFEERGHPDLARVALLHDATEAYMGDLVRPIKHQMALYQSVEEELQKVIFHNYGLLTFMPREVKEADLRITGDERDVLMLPRQWSTDGLEPLGVWIRTWRPKEAEQEWLERFQALFA